MNLHEYQAKDVFRSYGIPVPAGQGGGERRGGRRGRRARSAARVWVVKAQVHAGGRGKAGGVKLARDIEAVRAAAAAMLGTRLVTPQTGPEGLPVERRCTSSPARTSRARSTSRSRSTASAAASR